MALPDIPRAINDDTFLSETKGELTLVAVHDGQIYGFISVWEVEWFIHHLFVDPAAQGRGVGSALLASIAGVAKGSPVHLKCLTKNVQALAFYASAGFEVTDERGKDSHGDWVKLRKTPA